MKKVYFNFIKYLLAITLVMAFSGCSNNTIQSDDTITLDWYINFGWYKTPWGQNVVSKAITEKTGVSINFMVPTGSEAEKLNSMIASNSLPDLVTLGFWEEQGDIMIDRNMVYPLNKLAEEYDPYFFKVVDQDIVKWYTKDDGNIYGYPNSSYTLTDFKNNDHSPSNQTFLVRKDLYEAIGSPDMSTPEGFKQAIHDVMEMFPEINGEPLIPIGADEFTPTGNNSFDQYLQNFLAVPFEKDGKCYDRNTDEEYIRWLKVFRELNEEGYLKDEIFVDKRIQMEEKTSKGLYFCMIYQYTDIQTAQKILYTNDPNSVYIAVDGPRNSRGDDHTLPSTGIYGWTLTFISKNCKDPKRAIEFLTYLISEEGQKMVFLGVEGVTYDEINGEYVLKEEVSELLSHDRDKYDALYGANNTYWMLQDNEMQAKWDTFEDEAMKQIKTWSYPYTIYTSQYNIFYVPKSRYATINENINNLWGKTLPQLLIAKNDEEFNKILENFIEERDSLGYKELVDYQSEQLMANKKKLGVD